MNLQRIIILLLFIGLLAAPFILQQRDRSPDATAHDRNRKSRRLIILTPHNEQIRTEFKHAFEAWHQQNFTETVEVIWSVPGGTSDITRMLEAQVESALRSGNPVGGSADLMFGGGEYEHNKLKSPVVVRVRIDGRVEERSSSISQMIDFEQSWLDEIYGPNEIAGAKLYDPDRYWFGTAMSSFGIVYNNDVLKHLGLPAPRDWSDLCHPGLRGWVASGNPNQSGSIQTAFDTILQYNGWERGWQILRRLSANSRYFAASSSRVPVDVSQGDAAAGVCIDFFGRFQVQVVSEAGDRDRLGYIDPPGQTTIDADPISMLRGAPEPELAKRFVEFTLTEQGQALWQFRTRDITGDRLGPIEFELRRMPIRRVMYQTYAASFIDDVNPFEAARPVESPNRDYRSFIAPLFSAMVLDNRAELVRAWNAIVNHPSYPHPHSASDDVIVTAADVADPELKAMLQRFDAMPVIAGPAGAAYPLNGDPTALAGVKAGWLAGGWREAGLWPAPASPVAAFREQAAAFFKHQYESITQPADSR
ncbi:MAG: ABC transporter substrate-binding protein [Phycisphaerales bacterium]